MKFGRDSHKRWTWGMWNKELARTVLARTGKELSDEREKLNNDSTWVNMDEELSG